LNIPTKVGSNWRGGFIEED